MGLFTNRKNGGLFADMIRCDEPDYLIWKWRPAGSEKNTRRENAIRWGSPIRVKEGSVAVFVYQSDTEYQDFIEGPYDDRPGSRLCTRVRGSRSCIRHIFSDKHADGRRSCSGCTPELKI